jgi:hypothetical protein
LFHWGTWEDVTFSGVVLCSVNSLNRERWEAFAGSYKSFGMFESGNSTPGVEKGISNPGGFMPRQFKRHIKSDNYPGAFYKFQGFTGRVGTVFGSFGRDLSGLHGFPKKPNLATRKQGYNSSSYRSNPDGPIGGVAGIVIVGSIIVINFLGGFFGFALIANEWRLIGCLLLTSCIGAGVGSMYWAWLRFL